MPCFRVDFGPYLNKLGLAGTAAEVGVCRGEFSHVLLSTWAGQKLISVDPWSVQPDGALQGAVCQAEHEANYRAAVGLLQQHGQRSLILRTTSEIAALNIINESLDFCYIDAGHAVDAVTKDLNLWWPKLKVGGVFAGHDYVQDGRYSVGAGLCDFGVRGAVTPFAALYGLEISTTLEPDWPSWYVHKR